MKAETILILGHLTGDTEVARLRDWLLALDSSDPRVMATAINQLSDAIQQTKLHSHETVGVYRFFLACLYYELNDYQSAILRLQIAMQEMWGSPVNKSLVCWLLGLCYSQVGEFPEARRFLQDGLRIIDTKSRHFSQQSDRERKSRQSVEQHIMESLAHLFNEPLFRTVRPDPAQTSSGFPLQEPHNQYDEKGISISLNFPISVNNENNPINNVSIPSNHPQQNNHKDDGHVSGDSFDVPEIYESRTDQAGYMVLPSQPIYEQKLRAGNSGVLRMEPTHNRFVEITEIRLNGVIHNLYSIRSGKQINPVHSEKWGWMQVKGSSMNAMKGQISIEDGDFVFIRFIDAAKEGDVVVAFRAKQTSEEQFAVVKRYKQSESLLVSETNLRGPEYDPIDIKKVEVQIHGVVYAVAKSAEK